MQLLINVSLKMYIDSDYGKNYVTLPPRQCPICKRQYSLKKHGGYERNVISPHYSCYIYIHRYYCSHCGHTISLLPNFCIPYYQYVLSVIYDILTYVIKYRQSFSMIIKILSKCERLKLLSVQHISFYFKRFIANIEYIRNIFLQRFSKAKVDMKEDILLSIEKYLLSIYNFSMTFYEKYYKSFLSINYNSYNPGFIDRKL